MAKLLTFSFEHCVELGDLAIEGFTCLFLFKNLFAFGMTFKAYDWLVTGGIEPVFNALATLQLVICLLSIPMCESARSLSFPYI